jgi:hypothetical protein
MDYEWVVWVDLESISVIAEQISQDASDVWLRSRETIIQMEQYELSALFKRFKAIKRNAEQ